VCWDWTSNQNYNEALTPHELNSVDYGTQNSGIDILVFDACQMAYTEMYYELLSNECSQG
jgi:hypothetical protein